MAFLLVEVGASLQIRLFRSTSHDCSSREDLRPRQRKDRGHSQRRCPTRSGGEDRRAAGRREEDEKGDSKETRLTLMESVTAGPQGPRGVGCFNLLTYLFNGYTSFWNDCVLPDFAGVCWLAPQGRRTAGGLRREEESLLSRKVICKSDAPAGDVLLDEALKH
ncbi:Golgi phosphoprotein 3 [Lates japonicus]|uniref:Golgi phosphoprotein 3 n=1 Tax=Lates japonicus TaxID=270547 RepID=A0AAD3R1F6_LATJO|nr:Golgi phosphoprotein 3 [Lates japonicus]